MTDAHTRNVDRQIEWYGEPLGDRFAGCWRASASRRRNLPAYWDFRRRCCRS